MAVINNEELRDVYHYLATIENIILKESRHIKGNKSYVDNIVPEVLTKIYSQKLEKAINFSDNLMRVCYENSVVALLATFEMVIFAKYRSSYGKIRNVVKEHSSKPLDYFKAREKFVNDSIDKLHAIIELIEGHIDIDLQKKLAMIKDQRDYIAHGKRFGKAPIINLSITEIAETLDETISAIESK